VRWICIHLISILNPPGSIKRDEDRTTGKWPKLLIPISRNRDDLEETDFEVQVRVVLLDVLPIIGADLSPVTLIVLIERNIASMIYVVNRNKSTRTQLGHSPSNAYPAHSIQ